MKKKISVLLCGVLLVASGSVFAQSQDHGHDRGHHQSHKSHQHYKGMYEQGRHEGWYKRGGRVPVSYRGGTYVVSDWRARHLHRPPRGYHYVRSDNGDILLVAISTGIIANILSH